MPPPLKLAVIVATKNRNQLLAERSLPSIKNQSWLPDFLVVCDDSDTAIRGRNQSVTQNVDMHNSRIVYLENERTPGASGCWNTAVDFLTSQVDSAENLVLAFLDDDDSWLPCYLEQGMRLLQAESLNMVASGINRIERQLQIPIQNPAPDTLEISFFLSGNPGIQGSNLLLRLSTFLEAGGFDESLASTTDRDLCIRLAELGSVRYQAIPLFLVNHYADPTRSRLSTRGGEAKQIGLTTFWNKYRSRMNAAEATSFKQRAEELFAWHPPTTIPTSKEFQSVNNAIILEISADVSVDLLKNIVAFFQHFRQFDLVGLDVVFHFEPKNSVHLKFLDTLRNSGIGCFPIGQNEQLHNYAIQISETRPGSRIWITEKLSESSLELFINAEYYLSRSGARGITSSEIQEANMQRADSNEIGEYIYHQRVISAEHRVSRHFQKKDLSFLGSGSEAIVLTDGTTVYKCIDYWKARTPKEQFEFLRDCGTNWTDIPGIYRLEQVIRDGAWVLITYPYERSTLYQGGREEQLIELINSCTHLEIVCNNIHPKNLITTEVEVKLIDYGSDIRPWNALGFEHMARRAYLSCHHAHRADLKELMRQSLTDTNLPELEGYDVFRAKLDYPVNITKYNEHTIESAPEHEPFRLVVGVISADPIMLMPLLKSLHVLRDHSSLCSLDVIVLCNGCEVSQFNELKSKTVGDWIKVRFISEETQLADTKSAYFGSEIKDRPAGQVGIALARTMLQRYLGNELAISPNSVGWILDDDMRIDKRASDYIGWLPAFRNQNVDVLFGAYEGSSPNPPLNGLRVQLMDLVHNLAWLGALPEDAVLPDRTQENDEIRGKFPDYYYDLSRKHYAHLESPLWLEPSYPFETVKEARARLFEGALGILNGTPLTRSIIATQCGNPINEATDSVNRGGCTWILNPEALLRSPNLIPRLNGKEARRSDMIWAIITKHYRSMTLKTVAFPIYHIGRSYSTPTLNPEKVQGEIVGSALYAALTRFLSENPEHKLNFSADEVEIIYKQLTFFLDRRMRLLEQNIYRISGLTKVIANGHFYEELKELADILEQEFSLRHFKKIKATISNLSKKEMSHFLKQITTSTEAYSRGNNRTSFPNRKTSKFFTTE